MRFDDGQPVVNLKMHIHDDQVARFSRTQLMYARYAMDGEKRFPYARDGVFKPGLLLVPWRPVSRRFFRLAFEGGGSTALRVAFAAVFHQESKQFVHPLVLGLVDDMPAFLPAGDQAGVGKFLEVERQGRRRQAQRFADPPGVDAFETGLDQQAEDRQARLLRECGKGFDSGVTVHFGRILTGNARIFRQKADERECERGTPEEPGPMRLPEDEAPRERRRALPLPSARRA